MIALAPVQLRLGGVDRRRRLTRRRRHRGADPGSASPVSSIDFIDCSTQTQPSATFAEVIGLSPRSRWIVVSLGDAVAALGEQPLDTARWLLGGRRRRRGSATSSPSRLFGSTSSIDPTTASLPSGRTMRYGLPGSSVDSNAVRWKYRFVNSGSVIAAHTCSALARMKVWYTCSGAGRAHRLWPPQAMVDSNWWRRPTIAATVGSAYLEIQRSWISRIGTGLR